MTTPFRTWGIFPVIVDPSWPQCTRHLADLARIGFHPQNQVVAYFFGPLLGQRANPLEKHFVFSVTIPKVTAAAGK